MVYKQFDDTYRLVVRRRKRLRRRLDDRELSAIRLAAEVRVPRDDPEIISVLIYSWLHVITQNV